MTRAAVTTVAAALLVATPALAAEERPWSVAVGAGYVVLGPGERPTGGIAPSVSGAYAWPLGERWRASLGVGATAFGFASDARWIGVLVGPAGGLELLPTENARVGITLSGDVGRIPACTDWGRCLRFWGLFPRASLSAGYDFSPSVGVVTHVATRYVDTLAWTGLGIETGASGRFSW